MTRERCFRPTAAEISLESIGKNIRSIRNKLKAGVKILPIVKADAYGHGMIPVTETLIKSGARAFGVATLDEACALRERFKKIDILLLGSIWPLKNLETAYHYNIIPTIASPDGLKWYDRFLRKKNSLARVHLKIDTGMNRIGFNHTGIDRKIGLIQKTKNVIKDGIYTHFSSADCDGEFTEIQIENFNSVLRKLSACGINFRYVHAANSAAILKHKKSRFNMVRPGLLIYGLLPFAGAGEKIKIRPAMSVKSRVVFLKWAAPGEKISYGGRYVTPYRSLIATIPIGYADGYRRDLSNLGFVSIAGKRCFVTGRVCMDMIMADVSALAGRIKTGDEAVLIGSDMTVEKMASLCGTINYEITCGISKRVPRIYR